MRVLSLSAALLAGAAYGKMSPLDRAHKLIPTMSKLDGILKKENKTQLHLKLGIVVDELRAAANNDEASIAVASAEKIVNEMKGGEEIPKLQRLRDNVAKMTLHLDASRGAEEKSIVDRAAQVEKDADAVLSGQASNTEAVLAEGVEWMKSVVAHEQKMQDSLDADYAGVVLRELHLRKTLPMETQLAVLRRDFFKSYKPAQELLAHHDEKIPLEQQFLKLVPNAKNIHEKQEKPKIISNRMVERKKHCMDTIVKTAKTIGCVGDKTGKFVVEHPSGTAAEQATALQVCAFLDTQRVALEKSDILGGIEIIKQIPDKLSKFIKEAADAAKAEKKK